MSADQRVLPGTSGGPVLHGDIQRVGVVGSGTMGRGIVEVVASAGFEVTLRSRSVGSARRVVNELAHVLGRKAKRGQLARTERAAVLDRVTVTADLDDLQGCELVIECIIEDLPAKLGLFAFLDDVCAEHAILATNTSTLPVFQLARATERPERVCGLHFFNPAPTSKVIEVVRTEATTEATIERARDFSRRCGKQPIVVGDGGGFVVNALLLPLLNRAADLLQRGVASMEDIDAAMRGACGHQSGPFQLLDLIGVDTAVRALDAIYDAGEDPSYRAAPLLREMAGSGRLGRKTAQGFYRYR